MKIMETSGKTSSKNGEPPKDIENLLSNQLDSLKKWIDNNDKGGENVGVSGMRM